LAAAWTSTRITSAEGDAIRYFNFSMSAMY